MSDEIIDEVMQAYMDRELAPDEALAFEARLAREPELAAQYDRVLATTERLRGLYRSDAPDEASLIASRDRLLGAAPSVGRSRRTVLLVGGASAALAIMAGVVAWLLFWQAPRRAEDRWREWVRPMLATDAPSVTHHQSLMTPDLGGWTLRQDGEGRWLIEATDELPLPRALAERLATVALLAPGERLLAGWDGERLWLWRSGPRTLYSEALAGPVPLEFGGATSLAAWIKTQTRLRVWIDDSPELRLDFHQLHAERARIGKEASDEPLHLFAKGGRIDAVVAGLHRYAWAEPDGLALTPAARIEGSLPAALPLEPMGR